jgi:hypothetical protein
MSFKSWLIIRVCNPVALFQNRDYRENLRTGIPVWKNIFFIEKFPEIIFSMMTKI